MSGVAFLLYLSQTSEYPYLSAPADLPYCVHLIAIFCPPVQMVGSTTLIIQRRTGSRGRLSKIQWRTTSTRKNKSIEWVGRQTTDFPCSFAVPSCLYAFFAFVPSCSMFSYRPEEH